MNKDFLPDWLPAVLVRDVRQVLRSPKYLVVALVVLVLLALNVRPDEPASSRRCPVCIEARLSRKSQSISENPMAPPKPELLFSELS